MKRHLTVLIAIFFLPELKAQEPRRFPVLPIIEAGANITNQQIRRNADAVFGQSTGLRVALGAELPKTHRLTLLGTLSYAQAGSSDVLYRGVSEQLHYAELSIKAKEYLPVSGSDLFLSVGPYIAYGFNGKRTLPNGSVESGNIFNDDAYNALEWGLGGNFGIKFPWGSYLQVGLQTAFSNVYTDSQTDLAYFNYALMLTAGHSLNWRNYRSVRKR